jgi:hypothetical protein
MSAQAFHIVKLALSNVQGLIATSVEFPEGTTEVVIGGNNGSGKSSHLKGIEWLLTGLTGGSAGEFIRSGSSGATGSMTIKGANGQTYTITREKSESGAKVSIKSSDGGSHPVEFLKGLMGPGGFLNLNPFALAEMQPAKRLEAFKKAFELDFTALDLEDKDLMEEAKALDAKASGIRGFFQGQPVYENLPEEELSSATILAEIEAINQHNSQRDLLKIKSTGLVQDIDRIDQQIYHSQNEVARLENLLVEERTKLDALRQSVTVKTDESQKIWAEINAFKIKDTTELTAKLATIEETNQKIRDTKTRDKYRAEHQALEEQRVAANLKRDAIKAKKREMVASVEFPVKGLEFGDGDIMFRKPGQEPIPFDSLSSAEKLRVGTAFGLASSGDLKVVLTEDADRYDDNSRKIVYDMVKEAGGMLFLEMVRPSGGDYTLIIEEGKVKDAVQSQESLL